MESIGIYKLKKMIARGGMGEVFLAHDPNCERLVALKKMRDEYIQYESMRKRFLKEAKIAAQLSHPSIIPIHFIHHESGDTYYTMPYIEGDTLKDILKETIDRKKEGGTPHEIGSSIPSLLRIFLNVCQAVSFSHSHQIIHRDLKPGNIMVGKYGQVIILDWGLAQYLNEGLDEDESVEIPASIPVELTRPGKAVGTLTYMAPERAFNHPASVQSDIYALGIILYQILTLKTPFRRKSLKAFRQGAKYEVLRNPIEVAPERDIPQQLGQIAKKCLAFHPDDRYDTMDELIEAVENYIEGKPDWIFQKELSIDKQELWEFQENILLNPNIAIMRSSEQMQWVMLMVSKAAYTGNFRLEADITLDYGSKGVGLLFCMPQADAKKELEEGFCLWLGSKKEPGVRLYRSNIEVLRLDVSLKKGKKAHIVLEKMENKVSLHIDGLLIFNYMAYIPLVGSHVGLVCKDTDFKLKNWKIYVGSQSAMVNCLSIPDAFLAERDFEKAFEEYQRISQSFRGRVEGREAQFRLGITLIEQARTKTKDIERKELLVKANEEFEKLEKTSGAPLEYLGKSMIYRLEEEVEEEAKCLELAARKYRMHPLIHMIEEQVIFRMHESAKASRKETYLFALLALHFFPQSLNSKETLALFKGLEKSIEPLQLLQKPLHFSQNKERFIYLTLKLAFWLERPITIYELLTQTKDAKIPFISNCLFSLLYLGEHSMLNDAIEWIESGDVAHLPKMHYIIELLKLCQKADKDPLKQSIEQFLKLVISPIGADELILIDYLYRCALKKDRQEEYQCLIQCIESLNIEPKSQEIGDLICAKLHLLLKKAQKALTIFEKHSSVITHPLSHFYALYAIASITSGGKKRTLESFEQLIALPSPPITSLLAHFLAGNIGLKGKWFENSFNVEKKALYEQLFIYYKATGKNSKAESIRKFFENTIN